MNSLSPNVLVIFCTALVVLSGVSSAHAEYVPTPNPDAGLVRHGVFFRYTDETTPADKQNIILRYTQLMNLCVRPSDGQPYIVSFDAGFNASSEGWDQKMEHGYIVTFSSVDDRNYFVGRPFQSEYDPYHDAFKAFVGPYLRLPIETGLVVMDFSTSPLWQAPFPDSPAMMQNTSLIVRPPVLIDTNPLTGYVRHFVTFRFEDSVSEEVREFIVKNYTALPSKCVRPGTNQLYIVSMDGGPANSKEGFDQKMDQLYVMTFYNASDKDYFVDSDPFHNAFKAYVGQFLRQPISSGLFVFDFVILPNLPLPPFSVNNPNVGLVRHTVEFNYVDGTTSRQREEIVTRFAALANLCVRPTTTAMGEAGSLYIVSWDHGRNNSQEGFDLGLVDSFLVTFSSREERDYFVGRPFQDSYDPHHDAFKTFVGPFLRLPIATGLVVMDFNVAPVLGAYPFPPENSLQPNSSITIRRENAPQIVSPNAGLVHHIVTFRFGDSVTADQKRDVIMNYTSLYKKCVRPGTTTNYIVGFDGGIPNSKEGFDRLQEQLFIMTFSNISDKAYFVGRPFQPQNFDPFHDAFKAYVGPFLRQPIDTGLFVFDSTTSHMPLPPIVYNPNAGLVHHFVSFHYIEGLSTQIHDEIVTEFLSLMNKCVRPSDGALYIQSFDYGLNNSKEGFDLFYRDAFYLTFSSIEDRDYFIGRPFQQNYDPYYDQFKQWIAPYIRSPDTDNHIAMDWSVAPMQGLPFPTHFPNSTRDPDLIRTNQNVTTNPNAGLVRHIVIFRFADSVTPEQRASVVVNYTSLKTKCVNPLTYQPYLLSFDAGAPNSPEGLDRQMEQMFVITFASVADRDYFVGRPFQQQYDPYHDAFKAFVGPFLRLPIATGLFVFDFTVSNTPYPLPPSPLPPAPATVVPTGSPATAAPATAVPSGPATVVPTGGLATGSSTGAAIEGSTGFEPVVASSTGESPTPPPHDGGDGGNHKAVVVGVVVPLVVLAVGGAAFWFYRRRQAAASARAHHSDEQGVVYTDLSH